MATQQEPQGRADPNVPDADPEIPYRYFLEIGGVECVRFTKVSGLKMSTKVSQVREGGNNVFEHAMIESQTFDPLVIEKGFYSARDEFFAWMKTVHDPNEKVERQSLSLVILNDAGEETGRFQLYGAFITEYEGPGFDSKGKDIAFEKIKIHYDFFEYQKSG